MQVVRAVAAAALLLATSALVVHAQQPQATLTVPPRALIGDTFTASVELANGSATIGFGPRTVFTLPDGVQLVSSSPPARSTSVDPFTGVTTVLVDHPIGSLALGQPAQTASLTLRLRPARTVSPFAAVLPGQSFAVQSASTLYTTALLTTPVTGSTQTGPVAAAAFELTKRWNDLGEDEVLIGGPGSFVVTFRTAPAIALDDVDLFDDLPDTFVYASHTSSTAPTTIVLQPGVAGEPLRGGRLELLYSTIPANTTVTLTVTGSFPSAVASGPIVGGPSGQGVNGVAVVNTATAAATFAKATANQASLSDAKGDDVIVRALRLIKSATPSASPPNPGAATITYRLRLDASTLFDFSLGAIRPTITDTFSDGQTFDPTFPVQVGPVGGPYGSLSSAPGVVVNGDSTTTVTLTLDQGVAPEQLGPGATLEVVFRTTLDEHFKAAPQASVQSTDPMSNSASLTARGDDSTVGGVQTVAYTDGTSAATPTVGPTILKELLEVFRPGTGLLSKPFASPMVVLPGDWCLFRIRAAFPNLDAKGLVVRDYLPPPIFGNDQTTSPPQLLPRGQLPPGAPVGTRASFSPGADNDRDPPDGSASAAAYFAAVSAPNGEVRLVVGDIGAPSPLVDPDPVADGLWVVDYAFWVRVRSEPHADELPQVNQLVANFGRSDGNVIVSNVVNVDLRADAPVLALQKGIGVSTTVVADANVTDVDAGDTLWVRIDVTNTGGAPARSLVVTDDLPAGMTFVAGSLAPIGTTTVPTLAASPDPLVFTVDRLDAALTLSFRFQVRLSDQTSPPPILTGNLATISNAATVGYESEPGAGTFDPAPDSATVTPKSASVALTLVSTDDPTTTSPNVTQGEVVRLRARVTMPEGSTPGAQVRFDIPTGFGWTGTFTPATDVVTTGFDGTIPAPTLVGAAGPRASGVDVVIDFGTILTNANDDGDGTNNQLDVLLSVFCLSTASPGSTTHTATALSTTSSAQTSPGLAITVVSPSMSIPTPSLSPTSGDAGDAVTLTFRVANGGTSAGQDGVVTVNLGQHLVPGTIVPPAGFSATASVVSGDHLVTFDDGGVSTGASIAAGTSATFTVPFAPASTLPIGVNQAISIASSFQSRDGDPTVPTGGAALGFGERTDADVGSATLTVPVGTLGSAILTSSIADTTTGSLTVGELVTIRYTLTVPEGTLTNGQVVLPFPSGLSVHDADDDADFAEHVSVTGGPFAPSSVTASASTVTVAFGASAVNAGDAADNVVTIDVTARVNGTAARGASLTQVGNTSTGVRFTHAGGSAAPSNLAMLQVEPLLTTTKTFLTNPTIGNSVVTIELVTTNATSGVGSRAYDLVVTDDLSDPDLAYEAGGDLLPAGYTLSVGAGQLVTITQAAGQPGLAPGASATFRFSVRVRPTIPAGTAIPNTAGVLYTSTPGAPTAPNVERTPTASGGATLNITAPALDQVLLATSEASTAQVPGSFGPTFSAGTASLAHGELVTFRYRLQLPVGTSQALTVVSQVSDGTQFAGRGRLQYVSASVDASLFGGADGATTPDATLLAPTITGGAAPGADVTLAFGDVVVGPTDQANNVLLVDVVARVVDEAGNTAGTPLRSGGTVSTTLGGTSTGNVVDTAIVSASLTITTSISPAAGDAGDAATVAVVATNSGGSRAFDATITVPLDPDLVAPAAGAVTVTGGSGFTVAVVGQTVTVSGGELAPSGAVTVSIPVTVSSTVLTGSRLDVTPTLAASSLPGVQTGERAFSLTSTLASYAVNRPAAPTQALVSTTLAETSDGPFQLTPGEEATVRVDLVFPEGVTPTSVYTLDVPAGLRFVSSSILPGFGGATSLAPSPAAAGAGVDVAFDFGSVTRAVGGAGTLSLQVVLRADTTATGSQAIQGSLLTGAGDPPAPTALGTTPALTATIVRPTLALGTSIQGSTTGDAGDVRQLRITVQNTGAGPAYDIDVEDVVPAGFVVTSATSAGSFTANVAGNTVRFEDGVLDDGASVALIVTVTVAGTVDAGEAITNTVTATAVTAPANGAAVSITSASATFTVIKASLAQDVPTSDADTPGAAAAPGELVVHRYVVTVPEGETQGLALLAVVPPGFQSVSTQVITTGFGGTVPAPTVTGGAADGDDVTLSFGQITSPGNNSAADDAFAVLVTLRVLDVVGNVGTTPGQTTLNVNGSITHTNGGGTIAAAPLAGRDTAVVEPRLVIPSASWSVSAGDAGSAGTLTVTVQNTGLSAAQDVTLSDLLGGELTVTAAAVQTGFGFTNATSGNAVSFTGGTIPAGSSLTFTVDATLTASVVAGSTVTTTAQASGSSRPGVVTGERATSASRASTGIVIDRPTFGAPTASGGDAGTSDPNVTLGELVIFTLPITLPEGRTNGLVLTHVIPANLLYVAGSATVTGGDAGVALLGAPSVSGGAAAGDDVVVTIGDATNAIAGSSLLTVTLQARVVSGVGFPAGSQTTFTSNGQLTFTNVVTTLVTSNLSQTVVEPHVTTYTKAITPSTGDAGDPVTITITLVNDGTSAAHDVVVQDVFNGDFQGPAFVSAAPASGFTSTGSGSTVRLEGGTVPAGGTVTLTLSATTRAGIPAGTTATNVATGSLSSSAGTPTGDRTSTLTSNTAGFGVNAPGLPAQAVTSSTLPLTSDSPLQLSVGEEVTVAVELTIPEGTTPGLTYTLAVPPGLAYLPGSVALDRTGLGGAVANDPPLASGGPTYAAGQDVVFTLGDVVRNVGAGGTIVLSVTLRAQPGATGSQPIDGRFDFAGGPGAGLPVTPTLTGTIVSPALAVTKSFDPTAADAGDAVTVRLVVTNTGTGPAYDVDLEDVLDARLVVTQVVDAAGFTEVQTAAGAATRVQFLDGVLDDGASVTLEVRCTTIAGLVAGETVPNSATCSATTSPTSGVAATVDATGATATLTVRSPTLALVLGATSDPSTVGAQVTVGERVLHRVTIGVPEGQTQSLVVTGLVPPGYDLVGYTVVRGTFPPLGTLPAPAVTDGDPGLAGVPNVSGSDLDPVFDFGTVVNPPDGNTGNDRFELVLELVPLDVAGNLGLPAPGTLLPVDARLTFSNGGPTLAGQVVTSIVEPVLTLLGDVVQTSAVAGDVVTVQLALRNDGTSPAHDLLVETLLDVATVVSPSITATVTPAGWTFQVVPGPAGQVAARFVGDPATALDVGPTTAFAFTWQVKSTAALPATSVASSATASSLPGAVAGERTAVGPATDALDLLARPAGLDTDGDGILDSDEGDETVDTDGDGRPDFLDLDSDADGIPDTVEAGDADLLTRPVDTDGDGTPDFRDLDSDGDGIPDAAEGAADPDGDGVASFRDLDSDGDAIPDQVEGTVDTDGDGRPDSLDLDSDGDSISDSTEGTADTDRDGTRDSLDQDSDADGIPDQVEGAGDEDHDGTPSFRDLDSDGDAIPDQVEGRADTDGDGTRDSLDQDSDGDSIPDSVEGPAPGATIPADTDGDGTPDFRDLDADGDGRSDQVEGTGDDDGDGVPNFRDPLSPSSKNTGRVQGSGSGGCALAPTPADRGQTPGGVAGLLLVLGLAVSRRRAGRTS